MKWAIKWRSDGDWLRETVRSGHDLAFIWTDSKGKRFLFDSKEEAFKVRRQHQMGYARGTNGKRLLAVVRVARGTVDVRGLRPEAVARVLRAIERERARAAAPPKCRPQKGSGLPTFGDVTEEDL